MPAGKPELGHVEQAAPRQAQPLVDREAAVEVRIVDQALPADRRARLLEVDAHHDQQLVAQLGRDLGAGAARTRAPASGSWIEHGPDHHEQPVVLAAQESARSRARALATVAHARSLAGISSIRIAGGISGLRSLIRTSSVGIDGREAGTARAVLAREPPISSIAALLARAASIGAVIREGHAPFPPRRQSRRGPTHPRVAPRFALRSALAPHSPPPTRFRSRPPLSWFSANAVLVILCAQHLVLFAFLGKGPRWTRVSIR